MPHSVVVSAALCNVEEIDNTLDSSSFFILIFCRNTDFQMTADFSKTIQHFPTKFGGDTERT